MTSIRTTLIVLTYSIALLGCLPLLTAVDPVVSVFFAAAFVGGILLDRANKYPPGYLTTTVSIGFFLYYALQFRGGNFLIPAVHAIVILLGIRLVSEKNPRNHLQVFLLALIALAASTLFNLNAIFLLYLVLLLLLVPLSLVLITFYTHDSTMVIEPRVMKKLITIAVTMLGASIPLAFLFFVILPRTQHPLWNIVRPPQVKNTGFSETVKPGEAAVTASDKTIAFRADSPRLGSRNLYWRMIVLNRIVGDTWKREAPAPEERSRVKTGQMVRQVVYPEPSSIPYLVGLNVPLQINGIKGSFSSDHVFTTRYRLPERIRYEVISRQDGVLLPLKQIDRKAYLQLPAHLSEGFRSVAAQLKKQEIDENGILQRLEQFFVSSRLAYATSGLPTGPGALDAFLFSGHRGNCELFAASAATILRAAGVPTRLVGGYLGGVYNELGGYYTITEDMAHVWLEAYVAKVGWVTVDPSRWAVNQAGLGEARKPSWAMRIIMYGDLLGYLWNRLVITYDLERQLRLIGAANNTLKNVGLKDVETGLWLLSASVAVFFTVSMLRKIRRKTAEEKLVHSFLQVARVRVGAKADLGATGLYQLAADMGDPLGWKFVSIYGAAVYGDRQLSTAEKKELKAILASLNRQARLVAKSR